MVFRIHNDECESACLDDTLCFFLKWDASSPHDCHLARKLLGISNIRVCQLGPAKGYIKAFKGLAMRAEFCQAAFNLPAQSSRTREMSVVSTICFMLNGHEGPVTGHWS